jgi:hypothetical protein
VRVDEFFARFPDDENVKRSRAAHGRAQTDLYAVDPYEDRRKWQGAIWRYERVAKVCGYAQGAVVLLRAARSPMARVYHGHRYRCSCEH